MADIQPLDPAHYHHIPWKNGGGVLVDIVHEGGGWDGPDGNGLAWHYGRTQIVAEGPFSDLTGYERWQVVIRGRGLVLITPTGEIDLRQPFRPVRYDGGTPITTRLEEGAVEVANLIADQRRFTIDLRVGVAGETLRCPPGDHVVHAAAEAADVEIQGQAFSLAPDHAIRMRGPTGATLRVMSARVVLASVTAAPKE